MSCQYVIISNVVIPLVLHPTCSVVFAGELFGSLLWGPLADLHGRRWVYVWGCSLVAFGGVSSGLTSSFGWLLLFRGMVGVGIGGQHSISLALSLTADRAHLFITYSLTGC